MIQKYLQEIFAKAKTGDASERSYYSSLEKLLAEFPKTEKNFTVIIEGKNTAVGIPDFKISNPKGLLIGYVEAKDLGRNLDALSQKEKQQINKYLKEYPKLIVTNCIEFRLYEEGKLVDSVTISQPVTLKKIGTPVLQHEARFKALLERFFSTVIQETHTAKRLSELLAHKTQVLRGLIREEIDLTDVEETETEKLLKTFKETLKPDMNPEIFSDMYAQTITFGLFVARVNSDHQEFTRFTAHSLIPHTIPLLKKVFWILSGQDVPQHIEWQVDEIAEILANTRIEKITEEFFSHGKGRDPIIHFYETFLAEYDSTQREQLGVYYTPQPVVSYITKSLHKILKKHFGKEEGFADRSVITLDPAAGTLTFPAEAITIAKQEFEATHGTGGWNSLVKTHILKNFYAFEVLMAPYAVGHLKISLLLKELGYQMKQDERFELYLTNTLDMSKFHPQKSFLAEEISQESEKAYEIKDKVPVLVVMGNPPYSAKSANKGKWISEKIEDYKHIDGEKIKERNIKLIQDDYVKFFRFAQWKIDKMGSGVVGFITNHGWIDNPTFRGMRKSLMDTFNEIYVLNLHGSTLKKEKTPDGKKDENVFAIQPGVAITLLVKNQKGNRSYYYSEVWGKREDKYKYLEKNDIETTKWVKIHPSNPDYFLISRDEKHKKLYDSFTPLTQIFRSFSTGVKTHRDGLVVDVEKENLERKMLMLNNPNLEDELLARTFKLKDNRDWKLHIAREALRKDKERGKRFRSFLYRPFDYRWIYYASYMIDWPRYEVMHHLMYPNIALIVPKRIEIGEFQHAFCADKISDHHSLSLKETNYVFPLFTYAEYGQQDLLQGDNHQGQNINWNALPGWMSAIQPFTSPATDNFIQVLEAIFYYIYAILYSNIYREKYREFLKSDFPRIPFTNDYQTFQHMAILGEQLVKLHLLKAKLLDVPLPHYQGHGGNQIEKRDYHDDSNRLYINESQYFDKVRPKVWNYYIGGYQVLDKWLKDRIGRELSLDDQLHYRKIITALSETIKLQKRIDKLYPEIEKSLAS